MYYQTQREINSSKYEVVAKNYSVIHVNIKLRKYYIVRCNNIWNLVFGMNIEIQKYNIVLYNNI